MPSRQSATKSSLNSRQASHLKKVQRRLQDQGLLAVIESLLTPEPLTFTEQQQPRHTTIHILLGDRPKADGSTCQAWACIDHGRRYLKPPVVFYDREVAENGTRVDYKRTASSLLRRAMQLRPPFCFLQHDPHDDIAKDVRNMLCAVILYQKLMTGYDTCALQWPRFEESLGQALRYIETRVAYHDWLQDQRIDLLTAPKASAAQQQVRQPDTGTANEPDTAQEEIQEDNEGLVSTTSGSDFIGGMVRPIGSGITIKPGTSLSKLKDEIGDPRFQLLDNLPSIPMIIAAHNLGEPYFPFRLRLGTCDSKAGPSVDVFAYLIHDGSKKAALRIMSLDSDGHERIWTLEDTRQVNFVQPFDYLAKLKTKSNGATPGSSARAAKVRSVISYYFFLAENEGLIGDPRITIGTSFGKRLCTACVELGDTNIVNREDSKDGEEITDVEAVTEEAEIGLACEEEQEEVVSLVVELSVQPRSLRYITEGRLSIRKGREPESGSKLYRNYDSQEHLPSEETSTRILAPVQIEIRTSSQLSCEAAEGLLAAFTRDSSVFTAPAVVPGITPSETNSIADDPAHASIVPNNQRYTHADGQPRNAVPLEDPVTVDKEEAIALVQSMSLVPNRGLSPASTDPVLNAGIACARGADVSFPTELDQDVRGDGPQRDDGYDDTISIDSFLSPSLPPSQVTKLVYAGTEAITSWSQHSLLLSESGDNPGGEYISNERADSPESVSGCSLGNQPATACSGPPATSPLVSQKSSVVPAMPDLIKPLGTEARKDDILQAERDTVARTPEIYVQDAVEVDLSELSPWYRDSDKNPATVSDSDDSVEEVIRGQHQEPKRKWRKKHSEKEKAKRRKANCAEARASSSTRWATRMGSAAPPDLSENWYGEAGREKERIEQLREELSRLADKTELETGSAAPIVRNQVRETIDLTEATPSPRVDKGRTVILIVDSDDDLLEEFDHTVWQRASQGRKQ